MARTKVPARKPQRSAKAVKGSAARKTAVKKQAVKKAVKKTARRTPARGARSSATPGRLDPVRGATRSDVGGVQLEVGRAGAARVKRAVYPPGFRWSVDMKPLVGTELCMHGHVGFLESGAIRIEYPDGCALELVAPQVVAIEPGHDGAVIGDAPAVLIELDFEKATVERLGLPPAHRHA